VLARTNAQLSALETAFGAVGVPCHVASALGLLGRPWVQEEVRVAARAADAQALATWAADLLATTRAAGEDDEVPDDDGPPPDTRLDLAVLARLAGEYMAEDVMANGAGFKNWLEVTRSRDHHPVRRDAVELTTFHRAKGLEWAVVFVTGLEDGYVPIAHARDPDSLAEERRLLYVACTRAEEELHCSWAAERSFPSSRSVPRSPSPWLSAIEAAHRDLERLRQTSPHTVREALAESRRLLEGA
jgi:DNA helicase-2/ATP-dependent DNA helicase PcrA